MAFLYCWCCGRKCGNHQYIAHLPLVSYITASFLFADFITPLSIPINISVLYPTEFTKTQLQLPNSTFKGPVDVVRHQIRAHGILSLYNGLAPMVIGTAAKASVRFLSYDTFRSLFSDNDNRVSKLGLLGAGLGAGLTEAVLVVTPTEMLKTKMIHYQNRSKHMSTIDCIKHVFKTEGVLGFWQGLGSTMMRQGANSMCRFGVYGNMKEYVTKNYGTSTAVHPVTTFAIGMVAGTITVYVTMPLDVVKTKMQSLNARQYSSAWQCFQSIVQTNGATALWSGTTPRLSRLVFSGAIIFTVYEEIVKVLQQLDRK